MILCLQLCWLKLLSNPCVDSLAVNNTLTAGHDPFGLAVQKTTVSTQLFEIPCLSEQDPVTVKYKKRQKKTRNEKRNAPVGGLLRPRTKSKVVRETPVFLVFR